jgi:hypothetical protein
VHTGSPLPTGSDPIGLYGRAPTPLPDVEKLGRLGRRLTPAAFVSGRNRGLSVSCGEYVRRERDELRKFPQILGDGSQ